MRYLFVAILLISGHLSYADTMPPNNNMMPPPTTAPQCGNNIPPTGTDSWSSSYPMSNMNTIITQSVGTSTNNNPQSHPIPLNRIPNEYLNQ